MLRTLALLLTIAVLSSGGTVAAQDLNDIPPPDQLETSGAQKQLRIDWPADGEQVKVPFTVTGVAAPGARLELWLGDELERKFIADANGRFNTPVSRTVDADIWIHQVDSAGNRVQSANAAVTWAGAATPLAAPETVDETVEPQAEELPGEPVTDEDAAEIDPFAEPKKQKSGGLPKVDELGPGSVSAAPIPPPPSADPFAEPAPADATPAEAPDAIVDGGSKVELKPNSPPRGVRMIGEAGLGLAAAGVIGFAGGLLGVGIGLAGQDPFLALGLAALGGAVGWVVGVPVGVVLGGNMMDGNGAWWAAVLGEIAGLALSGLVIDAYTRSTITGDSTLPVITIVTLPIVGAVTGYEITSDRSAYDARMKARASRLQPALGRSTDGSVTMGLRLRF